MDGMEAASSPPIAPSRSRSSSRQRPPSPSGFLQKTAHHRDRSTIDEHISCPANSNAPAENQSSVSETKRRLLAIHKSRTQPIPINGLDLHVHEQNPSDQVFSNNWEGSHARGGGSQARDGSSKESEPLTVFARHRKPLDRQSRKDKETIDIGLGSLELTPESPVSSISSSKRKVFNFLDKRQNSFSSYLTQSRRLSACSGPDPNETLSILSQPAGILVNDKKERNNRVQNSGSLQEIVTDPEQSCNRRRRKDVIRRSVHFPENEVQYLENSCDEVVVFSSLHPSKNCTDITTPSPILTNPHLKKYELHSEYNGSNIQTFRGISKSATTSFEGVTFTKTEKENSIIPEHVTRSKYKVPQNDIQKLNFGSLDSDSHVSGIRVGGVREFHAKEEPADFFFSGDLSGKSSVTSSQYPRLPSKDSEPKSSSKRSSVHSYELGASQRGIFSQSSLDNNYGFSGDKDQSSTISRRNLTHKNSVARKISNEQENVSNPPVNIKRKTGFAPVTLIQHNHEENFTNHSQESSKTAKESFFEKPLVEPRKNLFKSSSTSTFRFFPQSITLKSNPNKPSRKGSRDKVPASSHRSAFFSSLTTPLSPDLADCLYAKMKGSHEGILVTACRLVEEEQVLRLIKELNLSGQLDSSIINECDKTGRTALSHASVNGYSRVVAALAALPGADLNLGDHEGNSPLHLAAQAGHVDVVAHLVNRCEGHVELDARDHAGFTPLMKAALQGRTKVVKTLLFAGASPHLRDYGRGLTAVEWARFTGRHLCCDLIESVERSCSAHVRERWASDPDLQRSSPPASVSAEHRESWIRHKVTEVKVADCYQDPEETLKSTSLSSSPGDTHSFSSSNSNSPRVTRSQTSPSHNRSSSDSPKPSSSPENKIVTVGLSGHSQNPSTSSTSDKDDIIGKDFSNSRQSFQPRVLPSASATSLSKSQPWATDNTEKKANSPQIVMAGMKSVAPQSVVTQTSGGRVVTAAVYSKGASVYTVQKSASVPKFSATLPSKPKAVSAFEKSKQFSFDN
ncbi:uncharacterized protein LOC108664429 [Hyalella azteca]|uniref:Uncharacterized protein LOC108664429 n=1 Tax=Hyalella azteca TaxID=294128 RepID=A0A8B7MY99_HYAAZ|nr:uncharacterized protein LOC108664429 [Hyalella azteca]